MLRPRRFVLSTLLATAVVAIGAVATAQTGLPSPTESEARFVAGGEGPYVLLIRPDGMGPPLTAARDAAFAPADASIELIVRDTDRYPVSNFPREDMWICRSTGDAPASCGVLGAQHPGFRLDANTDADGRSVLAAPPAGGGWSDGEAVARINGRPVAGAGLALRWNSPDIDGDLRVDLTDVGLLAADLRAGYHFRSDLAYDGVLNVSDVGAMAAALGSGCP